MLPKTPLGHIMLNDGPKEIFAMNDLFLNFTFEKRENWEDFRLILNILFAAYQSQNPDTLVTLIDGDIHIETQYKFYINTQNTTRNQDFKLTETEANGVKYIEFQNRAITTPPIEVRAIDYFVLGIGQSQGKTANQIWLLASDTDTVLQEQTFMNYILKDESTNKVYPGTSGIMFISLTRLSENNSLAGELASFLLGKVVNPKNEDVKRIAKTFKMSFEAFKDDKEVKNTMTMAEKYRNEGWLDGREAGREEGMEKGLNIGASKLAKLIRSGLSLDEALRKLSEEENISATL